MVMVMNDLFQPPLFNVNLPSHSEILLSMVKAMSVVKGQSHIWPSKFNVQGHVQGQTHWSHLRPGVQSICLFFISWQSDHFWLRYSKFHIWPWKIEGQGHGQGQIRWSYLRPTVQLICLFSFRDNRAIFGWDTANSIFDLEYSMSKSWRQRTKI